MRFPTTIIAALAAVTQGTFALPVAQSEVVSHIKLFFLPTGFSSLSLAQTDLMKKTTTTTTTTTRMAGKQDDFLVRDGGVQNDDDDRQQLERREEDFDGDDMAKIFFAVNKLLLTAPYRKVMEILERPEGSGPAHRGERG